MTARFVILTGQRRAGKSTVCRETISLAQARDHTCGGILTLQHPGDVLEVVDVRTGQTRPLTTEVNGDRAVVQGRFRFDPETLAWGKTVLAHATPCHLLVLDEIGPLELERGEG